jgi:type II secretory pathway predicted ATPase ExeA
MYNSYFGFRETPFSVTPDPHFFYTNSLYREAFATLRYGIEAKKGFVVITGEVGTGKTTLLRILMHNLGATIHSVFIFNTHLSFTELLRLILRDLGLAKQREDRFTMIQELNDYLIEQLKKDHIVSVLIDEAQNLSDETLEGLRLLSNLETNKEKLLQIVLMGQPELERKLDQPGLRQLKQRVALRCRLASLKDTEVGRYIDFRLQAAGYEGEGLFHPDAVEQIAFYSRGIPRLINIICDNALLVAYAGSKRKVAAEMIKEVASDLRLKEQTQVKTEAGTTEGKEEVSQAAKDDEPWESGSEEVQVRMGRQPVRPQQRGLDWTRIGILLALVILGGAGVALYSQETRNYLWDLGVNIEDFIGIRGENIEQAKHSSEALKGEAPDEGSQVQAPAPQDHALLPPPLPTAESLAPRSASKPPDEIMTVPKKRARMQTSNDPEVRRKRTLQIYKAIHNRAITGVEVSLIGATAYLDGRVETERQKFAAEQAARSVPEVNYVHNRIVVNSPPAPGEKESHGE